MRIGVSFVFTGSQHMSGREAFCKNVSRMAQTCADNLNQIFYVYRTWNNEPGAPSSFRFTITDAHRPGAPFLSFFPTACALIRQVGIKITYVAPALSEDENGFLRQSWQLSDVPYWFVSHKAASELRDRYERWTGTQLELIDRIAQ